MSDDNYLEVREFVKKAVEKAARSMAGEMIWHHASERQRSVFRKAARIAIQLSLSLTGIL